MREGWRPRAGPAPAARVRASQRRRRGRCPMDQVTDPESGTARHTSAPGGETGDGWVESLSRGAFRPHKRRALAGPSGVLSRRYGRRGRWCGAPEHGGYWVLTDYASVFAAARDDETFSSARSAHGGEGLNNVIPKAPVHLHIPVELDPPEHRTYRKIINAVTAPAALDGLRARIAYWTSAVRRRRHRSWAGGSRDCHRGPGGRDARLARHGCEPMATVFAHHALGARQPAGHRRACARARRGHPVDEPADHRCHRGPGGRSRGTTSCPTSWARRWTVPR
jgi:hypothetical protein